MKRREYHSNSFSVLRKYDLKEQFKADLPFTVVEVIVQFLPEKESRITTYSMVKPTLWGMVKYYFKHRPLFIVICSAILAGILGILVSFGLNPLWALLAHIFLIIMLALTLIIMDK